MTGSYIFDVAAFRLAYREFATSPDDTVLSGYWTIATCYIANDDYGWLAGDCRDLALNLMTAHIAKIMTLTNAGKTPTGLTNSATIGKVTVTKTPPSNPDEFYWWLNLSSYGQMLLVLLEAKAVGGLLVGGSLDSQAFPSIRCLL